MNPELQILVVILVDIKYFHPHRRACSRRSTVNGRFWHQSGLTLYISRRQSFLPEEVMELRRGTAWVSHA